MPKRLDLKRILIIGAGPIVIGQACEFDYSGTQACRALMQEGYEVVLVNSNPATIMTDPNMATRTYIEPLTVESLRSIIATERPDALLPTMGGQTALNLAIDLDKAGVLAEYSVELIGANIQAIELAEDRYAFKQLTEQVGLSVLKSEVATTVEQAQTIAETLGYPLIIRAGFTLGGSGGSVVYTADQLNVQVAHGLALSPISQVLLEESALGWKEYEFEVMRDSADNAVIVCSVENIDPMGVHTGDSMTVAPAQTLSDKEYQLLRNASLAIIRAVGVAAGGCNIQFAIHPETGRVVVIEMNPRVSRSSALVSKATGVPIAKVAAKLAVGMTLDEIPNDITRNTPACFEPAIDYVVTKIPRFSFEKFPGASTVLSPQMKSVGEVMAIGRTFLESFQKALRGLEIGLSGFAFPIVSCRLDELEERLAKPSPERLRWIYQALQMGKTPEWVAQKTGLDPWFTRNFKQLLSTERQLRCKALDQLTAADVLQAKSQGFSNKQIAGLLGHGPVPLAMLEAKIAALCPQYPLYKAVDTCAGEFEAYTPYYYSTWDGVENECSLIAPKPVRSVAILGGGPNRIGQGIEFDYCCVHAAMSLRKRGVEAVMVNSNPETVSTDYDISDRLYFEPMAMEDVRAVLAQEKCLPGRNFLGAIVQLGGQTPLKLSSGLTASGVSLLGTSAADIQRAEDRDAFLAVLSQTSLRCPESGIARTELEACAVAKAIGFPLIARPSFVLGGQSMRVFYEMASFRQYLRQTIQVEPEFPVLIDRFLEEAIEIDVDAVSDGTNVYIGGIMEHIEHAGVHSGDSACALPAQCIDTAMEQDIVTATVKLAQALHVKGLLNIQFAVKDGLLYVLEVNPRASRTVPFVSKATGVNLIDMAVGVMLGESLPQTGVTYHRLTDRVAVKEAVFPFVKFREFDPVLGPEMRSTGEVMGMDETFAMAYAKAQQSAGCILPITPGAVFFSVWDADKPNALPVAQKLVALGFSLVATEGTARFFETNDLHCQVIAKKHNRKAGDLDVEALLVQGTVTLLINTPQGEAALNDDSFIRKLALAHNVPMATTLAGAMAMAEAIEALQQHAALDKPYPTKALQLYEAHVGKKQVSHVA